MERIQPRMPQLHLPPGWVEGIGSADNEEIVTFCSLQLVDRELFFKNWKCSVRMEALSLSQSARPDHQPSATIVPATTFLRFQVRVRWAVGIYFAAHTAVSDRSRSRQQNRTHQWRGLWRGGWFTRRRFNHNCHIPGIRSSRLPTIRHVPAVLQGNRSRHVQDDGPRLGRWLVLRLLWLSQEQPRNGT